MSSSVHVDSFASIHFTTSCAHQKNMITIAKRFHRQCHISYILSHSPMSSPINLPSKLSGNLIFFIILHCKQKFLLDMLNCDSLFGLQFMCSDWISLVRGVMLFLVIYIIGNFFIIYIYIDICMCVIGYLFFHFIYYTSIILSINFLAVILLTNLIFP